MTRRPSAYLQCCHNLAWLALDDVANDLTGAVIRRATRADLRALDAVSAVGDLPSGAATPEDYEAAALDLLNLASVDALDGASEMSRRKLKARERLKERVDAARALLRGARD